MFQSFDFSTLLQNIQSLVIIIFVLAAAFAIIKLVKFFTHNSDSNSILDNHKNLNTENNILIGHINNDSNAFRSALVNSDDKSVSEVTYNNFLTRLKEIEKLYGNRDQEIHIHLHTPGGELFFGKLIAMAIYEWPGRTIAHIHSYSASAGTLIAVSCDDIHMDHHSMLGPVDPQIKFKNDEFEISIVNYLEISKTTSVNNERKLDNFLHCIRVSFFQQIMDEFLGLLTTILNKNYSKDDSDLIIKELVYGKCHAYLLNKTYCKKIGLNIK